MRRLIILMCIFCQAIITYGQNNVNLIIQHKLGEEDFSFDRIAENNINTSFKLTRLEYYISGISLVHDGGQITEINDRWILVDAADRQSTDLGNLNINNVEKLIFHIGVDPQHNNADPSTYPANHPLALQIPSMHWGWASGYNFVALEGLGDVNYDKVFQIHALGNENYKSIEIELNESAHDNKINLNVVADYTRAMEEIDAGLGIFYHGTSKHARTLIENFNKYVFTAGSTASRNKVERSYTEPGFFPGVLTSADKNIIFDCHESLRYDVIISDINGKVLIRNKNIHSGASMNVDVEVPGLYFVSFIHNGKVVLSKKLLFMP